MLRDLKFFSTQKGLLFPKKFPNNVRVPKPKGIKAQRRIIGINDHHSHFVCKTGALAYTFIITVYLLQVGRNCEHNSRHDVVLVSIIGKIRAIWNSVMLRIWSMIPSNLLHLPHVLLNATVTEVICRDVTNT